MTNDEKAFSENARIVVALRVVCCPRRTNRIRGTFHFGMLKGCSRQPCWTTKIDFRMDMDEAKVTSNAMLAT